MEHTKYSKVETGDVDFLKALCSRRVFAGIDIHDDYMHDEMPDYGVFAPDVVVEVTSTEEVSKIVAYANERNIPIVPRGAGTGLCGGCVAIHGGIMISTVRMNKNIEIDEENLCARVQAGVILQDLIDEAQKLGLLYCPDPGEKSATVGGNIMTNAGGMKAVRYGVTKDHVLGMTCVLADGTVLETGGKVVKDSSGYNLQGILIGSEGTLCVLTEAIVKLMPLPPFTMSLLVPFDDIETSIAAVPKVMEARIVPAAIEFAQQEVVQLTGEYLGKSFPHDSAPAYLIFSFNGNSKNELEDMYTRVAEICLESDALDVFIADTKEQLDRIWTPRGEFLEAIKVSAGEMDECDVVVPRSSIVEFIHFVEELRERQGIRILSFGHAGDGNLHVYVCRDGMAQGEYDKKLRTCMDALYENAKELGGKVSGEHGIGHAKIEYLEQSLSSIELDIMKSIKNALDPKGILNPGKVLRR